MLREFQTLKVNSTKSQVINSRAAKAYYCVVSALLFLVLANAVAASLRTVSDLDMGWHLATGRWVVQHHAIPSTDVLSYTSVGQHWIYSPFADVLLYLTYRVAGYPGLSALCLLVCVMTVAYLVRRRDLASLVLAMFAINPIAFRAAPRADLFSALFLAIFLGELWDFHRGAGKRLWVLPLAMLIWVNFHPGFILGLAVIGAYLTFEAGEMFFAGRRDAAQLRLRTTCPWLAGTIAITLINPWGINLYLASFALSGVQGGQAAAWEFSPYGWSRHLAWELFDFRYYENGFLWLMIVAVLVVAFALRRRRLGVVPIQAIALYLALQHVRYIGLFCVVTTILGATLLGEAFSIEPMAAPARNDPHKPKPLLRVPPMIALVFVCAIGAIIVLHINDFVSDRTHVVYSTYSRFGLGESSWFPERAAAFIRHERLPGNVFEEYELGGFAAWSLGPEYLDFIDGRNVNPAVLEVERKLLRLSPDSPLWQAAADRWGINVLLIPEAEPNAEAVVRRDAMRYCESQNWRPVYMDELSLVLLRNVPANRSWIDRLQIDCRTQQLMPPKAAARKDLYDFYINAGGLLSVLNRDQESERTMLRASELYPKDPNARLLLGQFYLNRMMLDQAEAQFRASLALNETEDAWTDLGALYLQEMRLQEAARAYTRALQFSADPAPLYRQLAQIESWQQLQKGR